MEGGGAELSALPAPLPGAAAGAEGAAFFSAANNSDPSGEPSPVHTSQPGCAL